MVTRSDLSVAVLAVRWVLQESEERQHSRLHLFSISWNVLRRPECTRKKKNAKSTKCVNGIFLYFQIQEAMCRVR